MKKVMVIGTEGFLGRRVVEFFRLRYDVIGLKHNEVDIANYESVVHAFHQYNPDYVINCAAISSVDDCEKDMVGTRKINVDGCVNIAKAAFVENTKCIFCSSDQVYFGDYKECSRKESEILHPCKEYGRQKLDAEKIILKLNPEAVFLRLSWMYDVVRKSEKEHSNFFVNLIAQLENGMSPSLAIHDIRGITDVNEVIANMEKAFELAGGVYNFGSSAHANVYETVRRVFEEIGWDANKIIQNLTAFQDNPRNMGMDQTKINQHGIYFKTTEESLTDSLLDYYRVKDC